MSSEENLFSRLERYSQNVQKTSKENFITEIFAFVLEEYAEIRKRFLELVFPQKLQMVDKFQDAEIITQKHFSGGIIDILFRNKKINLYIENKVDSSEGTEYRRGYGTKTQIIKYLEKLNKKTDSLVYITKHESPYPDFRKSPKNKTIFCGHIHWDEIYEIVEKYNKRKKSKILNLFLQYMEENSMGETKGFTKTELKESRSAFSFLDKSEKLVEKVKMELGKILQKNFGKYEEGNQVNYDWEYVEWWYRSRKWKKSQISISLDVWHDGDNPGFTVELGTSKKKMINRLMSDDKIIKNIKILEKKGWTYNNGTDWWSIYKFFKLKPGSLEKLKIELVRKIKIALTELKSSRIINMINNRTRNLD